MAESLSTFARRVVDAGLLSADELQAFYRGLDTPQRPGDGAALAQALIAAERLTPFQAGALAGDEGPPLVLGEYELLDPLGAGGMGHVFRARHRRMDRLVAVKLIAPSREGDSEVVQRFEREVKAAAQLSHPNIVTAYDAGEHDGTVYLVMELVDGVDLSRLVKQSGPLPEAQAASLIAQAARGLQHAHEKGIVHRDVKPSNLLLDCGGVVKVLDLGLAGLRSAGGEASELTQSGQIMGTVDYMAPEQARSTREVDHRADVYSLGCTLHYLLTGRPPFEGESVTQRLVAHQSDPPPDLRALGVGGELAAVYDAMLAKSPAERVGTMREVISRLQPLVCDGALTETFVPTDSTDSIAPYVSTPRVASSRASTTAHDTDGPRRIAWSASLANRGVAVGCTAAITLCLLVGFAVWKFLPEKKGPADPPANAVGAKIDSKTRQITSPPRANDWPSVLADLKRLNPGFDGQENASYTLGDEGVVLRLQDKNIVDISPVARLENLGEVHLDGSRVVDLGPLAGSTTWVLDLSETPVRDLAPLAKLPFLDNLEIDDTLVESIAPLAKALRLRRLDCNGTNISDVSPLAKLKLDELVLADCPRLSDITPLASINTLAYLEINETSVADISPVGQLSNLEFFDCSKTPVTDLSPLKGLTRLSELKCDPGLLAKSPFLREMKSLKTINGRHAAKVWESLP